MKTFIKVIGAGLLTLSCVTASDARSHAKRHSPIQSEADYYRSDYDTTRDRESSFVSRPSTGLPNECSTHGGG